MNGVGEVMVVALVVVAVMVSGAGDTGRWKRSGLLGERGRAAVEAPGATVEVPPALVLDLLAAVLEAGAPPRVALERVAEALETERAGPLAAALREEALHLGGEPDGGAVRASAAPRTDAPPSREDDKAGWEAVRAPLSLAAMTGVPPAEPMRRAAGEQRRRAGTGRAAALRRLEVMLVLPTGLCLLPAFVLLGVAPVVIDLFLAR